MITIRLMQESERSSVALLAERVMRIQYHCDAYELPPVVFVAWQSDGELVGIMGLSMSSGNLFSLETTYALDYATFPVPFDRSAIVQLGRWIATVPNISEALLYIAMNYAICEHRVWGIGEVKPNVARRYARMGLKLVLFSGTPILANIPTAVQPYYVLPPKPTPCALFLPEAVRQLRDKVVRNTEQNHIVFESH